MSRFWSTTGVAVAVWLALSPLAGAAEFPTGTFTASRQKDWSIKFEPKGKLTVLRGGRVVVEGTYKASATEVTLTDERGPFAGTGDTKTGTYKWKLEGGKLTFTKVKDESEGRSRILTIGAWERQEND